MKAFYPLVVVLLGSVASVVALNRAFSQYLSLIAKSGNEETLANATRLGSFLVIGDWGWDPANGHDKNIKDRTCQQNVAALMEKTRQEVGDVKFVINVGDSFYPNGYTPQRFENAFTNVYSNKLRALPWYSVYGNHDYEAADPCACEKSTSQCTQLNAFKNAKTGLVMPDLYYKIDLPDLDVEIVALDLNQVGRDNTCRYAPCQNKQLCQENLYQRSVASTAFFKDRLKKSSAKHLIVFSHYPSWFLQELPASAVIEKLRETQRPATYFGGHTHKTEKLAPLGSTPEWMVGGCGGWHTEGMQGIVLGQIYDDGRVTVTPKVITATECTQGSFTVGRGIQWNGDWAKACDFEGNDISNQRVPADKCGPTCGSTPGCTHYSWTDFNGGTCWMKGGQIDKARAKETVNQKTVCGVISSKAL